MLICDSEYKLDEIIQFLAARRSSCLYAYLDLLKYGLENEDVTAWADTYDGISSVAMRYHNGMHLCADPHTNYHDLSSLILAERPAVILGERKIIGILSSVLKEYGNPSYGVVMSVNQLDSYDKDNIEHADVNDANAIANLIMTDASIGAGYTTSELVSQITERQKDGYGRNYVIRQNGRIIAHAGTGAEFGGVATIVDVVVDISHRRQGLGRKLVSVLSRDLVQEGMTPYLFCYSGSAQKLYESIGYEVVCEWARMDRVGQV